MFHHPWNKHKSEAELETFKRKTSTWVEKTQLGVGGWPPHRDGCFDSLPVPPVSNPAIRLAAEHLGDVLTHRQPASVPHLHHGKTMGAWRGGKL